MGKAASHQNRWFSWVSAGFAVWHTGTETRRANNSAANSRVTRKHETNKERWRSDKEIMRSEATEKQESQVLSASALRGDPWRGRQAYRSYLSLLSLSLRFFISRTDSFAGMPRCACNVRYRANNA